MPRKRLGELLVMAGAIDEFQLQSALGEQRRWGRPLGVTLVELGLIEEDTLVKILSTQLNIPAIDLSRVNFDPAAIKLLDFDLCSQYQVVPFRYDESGKFLYLAMADPTNLEIFDRIRVQTKCNPRPHLAGPRAIENAIRRKYLGEMTPGDQRWLHRPDEMMLDGSAGRLQSYEDAGFGLDGKRDPAMIEPPPGYVSAGSRAARTPTGPSRPAGGAAAGRAAPRGAAADGRAPDTARFDEQLMKDVLRELKEVKAMLTRDEMVLRKLMSLIVQKGLCTRDELVARLHEE